MTTCKSCRHWATDGPYGSETRRACRMVQRSGDLPKGVEETYPARAVIFGALITHQDFGCNQHNRAGNLLGSWQYPDPQDRDAYASELEAAE